VVKIEGLSEKEKKTRNNPQNAFGKPKSGKNIEALVVGGKFSGRPGK